MKPNVLYVVGMNRSRLADEQAEFYVCAHVFPAHAVRLSETKPQVQHIQLRMMGKCSNRPLCGWSGSTDHLLQVGSWIWMTMMSSR